MLQSASERRQKELLKKTWAFAITILFLLVILSKCTWPRQLLCISIRYSKSMVWTKTLNQRGPSKSSVCATSDNPEPGVEDKWFGLTPRSCLQAFLTRSTQLLDGEFNDIEWENTCLYIYTHYVCVYMDHFIPVSVWNVVLHCAALHLLLVGNYDSLLS